MSTVIYHNHHIIPRYRCKEIGIDPDFEGNIIRLTRLEHAEAHYHRWLKNGRSEDLGAAQLLAEGEIDGLDTSGENSPRWGKHHSEETRKKLSKAQTGKTMSEEARKKIGDGHRGKPSHRKGKTGIWSEETLKKFSEAKMGKSITEEHRKNISIARKKFS